LLVLTDETRRSVELGHDLLAAAEATGDRTIQAGACLWLGCGYYALGRHRRAVEFLGKSRAILEDAGQRSPLDASMLAVRWPPAGSPGYHSMFLGELGEFARGAAAGADVLRIVEAADRPWALAIVCWQVGHLYCTKGDFDHALGLLERAISVAQEWGFARTVGLTSCVQGYALALSGRVVEGVQRLEQGMRQTDGVGLTWLLGQRLNQLGEAYLLAGRLDDAQATAERSLELCRQRAERGFEAWALRLLAEIVSRRARSDVKPAEELYASAIALANELEMRPLAAHCHHGLGKLYRRMGSQQSAQEHLTIAMKSYREMDMTFWVEQATASET
jgi:tetratricopeptide (TPR) repeat protein